MSHERSTGFSLIEVLLAISILMASLLALGQLLSLGRRQLQRDDQLTTAQLLADSQMNGLASGAIPLAPVAWTQFPRDPAWSFAIDVTPTEWEPIMSVQVHVARMDNAASVRALPPEKPTITLMRWFRADQLQQDLDTSTDEFSEPSRAAPQRSGVSEDRE